MQEIIIEIMLTFCVGAMTFSVKRGGSEPMHDLRISMGFQNHFNERVKLSRRITIEQKIKSLPAAHLRALLRHLTEDRSDSMATRSDDLEESTITKSRRKTKKSMKSWRKTWMGNKTKTSRFQRFKQFHGASENEMNTASFPV